MSQRPEHFADPGDVFNSGLLTPPGSHIMDDGTPRRCVGDSPCTPVGFHTRSSLVNDRRRSHQTSQSRPRPRALGSSSTRSSSAQVAKRKRNSVVSTSISASGRNVAGEASVSAVNDLFTTELHTPNPKPRKQSKPQSNVQTGFANSSDPSLLFTSTTTPRLRSLPPQKTSPVCTCGSPSKRILYDSLHAANVNADYIPSGTCPSRKCKLRARSTTPSYEAPRERFTPPREIEITSLDNSRIAKAARRGVSEKPKRPSPAYVKRERPEVDLSQALRPPSPTDDPLLLSDGHSTKSSPLRCCATPTFSSSPFGGPSFSDPPKSFAARLSGGRINDFGGQDDSDILPVFNLPDRDYQTNPDDDWSDSEDEDEFNLTGEYTGKYKILKVPTKADPPTSGTRERMVSWGRPVSPFPYSEIMERSLPLSDLTEEDVMAADTEDIDEYKVLRRDENALPPSDDATNFTEAMGPPASDEIWSSSSEVVDEDDAGNSSRTCRAAQSNELSDPSSWSVELHSEQDRSVEEEEEDQVDRELSVAVDDGQDDNACLPRVLDGTDDVQGDESSDEDEDLGGDVVKITSGDATAAARAAAILKLHDYDCIFAASVSKGRSSTSARKRRTTMGISGIMKPYRDRRVSHQRQTIHGDLISALADTTPLLGMYLGDQTPGRASCDAASASCYLPAPTPRCISAPASGGWGREDWKRLDRCLFAERVSVRAGRGSHLLVAMRDISKDAVLERFTSQMGGEPVLQKLGPEWTRENLIMRLEVLIRKQPRSTNSTSFRQGEGNNISFDSTIHRGNPCYHSLLQEALAVSSIATPNAAAESSPCDVSRTFEQTQDSQDVPLPLPSPAPDWVGHGGCLVTTPSRPPDPKAPHPKERVHLRHASLPKKSRIPVAVRPQRLVDLRHLSPSKLVRRDFVRPQVRVSGGFRVKDLIRCFEDGGS
ncbi:hypothetical protein F5I97DRAFT_136267 [Phlebopus sp. FC_14]|nr:hypothetical protein F5I97DRAFT_136267 [Phlebopus sp. FC_14]